MGSRWAAFGRSSPGFVGTGTRHRRRADEIASVPRPRGLHRLPCAIVLGEELPGALDASDARRELRLVLAGDPHGGGGCVELGGVEVPAAGDAVDVRAFLRLARGSDTFCGLALALGQLLLALLHPVLSTTTAAGPGYGLVVLSSRRQRLVVADASN